MILIAGGRMNFTVKSICGKKYHEVTVDEIESGTMDNKEAKALAISMILAAGDLLYATGKRDYGDRCYATVDSIENVW